MEQPALVETTNTEHQQQQQDQPLDSINKNVDTPNLFEVIPHGQTHLNLVNDDGQVKERLDLADIDPIFSSSFADMIKDAFAEGKHFLLAKIQTKQDVSSDEKYSSAVNHNFYYNAYGILKLLFQKKNGYFVGRFHERFPITAKNPVTNSRITGEVEFYIVRNQRALRAQQVQAQAQEVLTRIDSNQVYDSRNNNVYGSSPMPPTPEKSDPLLNQIPCSVDFVSDKKSIELTEVKLKDKSINLTTLPQAPLNGAQQQNQDLFLQAEFHGTDFNFIYSTEMQLVLVENCINAHRAQLLAFDDYQESEQLRDRLQLQQMGLGVELDFNDNMQNVVQESFNNTSKFIRMGALNFLFYFSAGFTILSSGFTLLILLNPDSDNQHSTSNSVSQSARQKPTPEQVAQAEAQAREFQIKQTIFYLLMPLAAQLYHYELTRVCGKAEFFCPKITKHMLCLMFYITLIYSHFFTDSDSEDNSGQGSQNQLNAPTSVNGVLFIASSLLIVYSYAIFNWRSCQVVPANNNQNGNGDQQQNQVQNNDPDNEQNLNNSRRMRNQQRINNRNGNGVGVRRRPQDIGAVAVIGGVNAFDSVVPNEQYFRHHYQNENIQLAFDEANFGVGLAEAGQVLVEYEMPIEEEQQIDQQQFYAPDPEPEQQVVQQANNQAEQSSQQILDYHDVDHPVARTNNLSNLS